MIAFDLNFYSTTARYDSGKRKKKFNFRWMGGKKFAVVSRGLLKMYVCIMNYLKSNIKQLKLNDWE